MSTCRPVEEIFPAKKVCVGATRPSSDEDHTWLRNELAHSDRFQVFVWLLSDEREAPVKTVPTVEDIILRPAFLESADKIDYVCNHLGLKDDEVQFVREQTCGQSCNPLQACYRKG